MAKFSNQGPAQARGPIRQTGDVIPTFEGGRGYARSPESELFILAAVNMWGEDTFYESALDRDSRFVRLVHEVTKLNPEWIAGSNDPAERAAGKVGFIGYLRNRLNMRSASIVLAAEYVRAGGPNGRSVVDRAIARGDEPAEMIGYWLATHGRRIPAAIKRGVADSTRRLYTERNALRYDGLSRGIRMADVIELVHPKPRDTEQSALFHYLLDKRHHPDSSGTPPILGTICADRALMVMVENDRREALRNGIVAQVGWSWERLSGWLPGGMDKEAWEHVIPQMGYMALIRNLRNFDNAGIDKTVRDLVLTKIMDPDEVAKSRQFPYRFWSAYKNTDSLEWAPALEKALELSCGNIPEIPGRTLVLIDISGSMHGTVSNRSKVMRYEVGALFGAAVAKKCGNADVALFADGPIAWPVKKNTSVLRYVESVGKQIGRVGYGTNIHGSLQQFWNGHDRVVLFSDEAAHDNTVPSEARIPMIHVFNLGGYRAAAFREDRGRCWYGGFSDAFFEVMHLVENGNDADWPF